MKVNQFTFCYANSFLINGAQGRGPLENALNFATLRMGIMFRFLVRAGLNVNHGNPPVIQRIAMDGLHPDRMELVLKVSEPVEGVRVR